MDLVAQFFPQIMRQTSAAVDAATGYRAGSTSDRVDRLVDGEDDVGNPRVVAVMRQQITAARTAHALDQTAATQLGEKLLEIGQRNLLALGDIRQAHRRLAHARRALDARRGRRRRPHLQRCRHRQHPRGGHRLDGEGYLRIDLETIQRNTGVRFGDYFSNFSLAGFLSTRSLLFVTFAFNHWVGGQNVTGYHILNLAFHVLNGLLVFFTARNIFRRVRSDETTVRLYAMLAAAFFLVHPVQTESVTYVSSRSELLSTFFYLAGFAVFVFTPEQKIGFLTAISVLACLLLGFGGKETIVTLPLAILLFDFLFIAKGSFKAICTRWRFYLIFVIAAALSSYYLLAKQVVRLQATGQTLLPRYYFLTQQRVIARYLRLVVLPAALNLDLWQSGAMEYVIPRNDLRSGPDVFNEVKAAAAEYNRKLVDLCYRLFDFLVLYRSLSNVQHHPDPRRDFRASPLSPISWCLHGFSVPHRVDRRYRGRQPSQKGCWNHRGSPRDCADDRHRAPK